MHLLRSLLIVTLASAAAVHATFAVTFYSGAQCSGSSMQILTVDGSDCTAIPADVQSGAGSATVIPDGSEASDEVIAQFLADSSCEGAPLAQADIGCVTFTDIGVPMAISVSTAPVEDSVGKRSAAAVLSFDEAWEHGQREAGLTVEPLPEVPEGYKWLTVYMGQWLQVTENTTLRDIIREHGLDIQALQMEINYSKQTHECDGVEKPSDCHAPEVAEFARFDVA